MHRGVGSGVVRSAKNVYDPKTNPPPPKQNSAAQPLRFALARYTTHTEVHDVQEILTRWSGGLSASEMVSVMYFGDLVPIADARGLLADFWTAVSAELDESYTWSIDTEGRQIAPATGQTVGVWQSPLPLAGNGGVGFTYPVSNASMVLFQWRTGVYRNGREVRGRTFIPGLATNRTLGGELDPAARVRLRAAAQTELAETGALGIWSRPRESAPGEFYEVTNAGVWNELAVLRGRRA